MHHLANLTIQWPHNLNIWHEISKIEPIFKNTDSFMNFFHVSYLKFRGWHHYPLSSQNPHDFPWTGATNSPLPHTWPKGPQSWYSNQDHVLAVKMKQNVGPPQSGPPEITVTPPKFNSKPLKMDGWNIIFLLGPGNFSGMLNFRWV